MKRLAGMLLVVLALGGMVWAQNALLINGAGATFPYPIYSKWFDEFHKSNSAQINYQSVGSGAGIKQVTEGTVDFGATDGPMNDEQIKAYRAKNGTGILHFPTVLGAVVPTYNVPGVSTPLNFTPDALAGIFLGRISKWNDPAIASLNPGVQLPSTAISVVHRSDGSGTTFIWTNYLSKVSEEWKAKVGEGTAVNWPTGVGGKGNEGVASYVQRIDGAIGYVEYAYAKQNKMAYTLVKNKEGEFAAPNTKSFQAAAAGADWKAAPGMYLILTDAPGKGAWPIAGATFILMHKAQEKPANAKEVLKFFDWAYSKGDNMAQELDYVPLPDAVVGLIQANWKSQLKDPAGKPLY